MSVVLLRNRTVDNNVVKRSYSYETVLRVDIPMTPATEEYPRLTLVA